MNSCCENIARKPLLGKVERNSAAYKSTITIALNCMRGYWRKQRTVVDLEEVPLAVFSVVGDESEVDDRDAVVRLLGLLDQEERELVLMKHRDGKRNVDIAHELGMNQSTVSTKLFNAMTKMRAAGEGYGF